MSTIYTIGYGNRWQSDQLAAELERLAAVLWDIRHSPYSRRPEWGGAALRNRLGRRYVHVAPLGNRNYKGGPIELVNPAAAVGLARVALARGPVALLCGCKDAATCHRSVAADYLAGALGGVPIVHLDPPGTAVAPPASAAPYRLPEVADLPDHL